MSRISILTLFLLITVASCASGTPEVQSELSSSNDSLSANAYRRTGAPLPASFAMSTLDGSLIQAGDLSPEKQLLIMIFNPLCDHCEDQAAIFRENPERFRHTEILMITDPGMMMHLEYFARNMSAEERKTLRIGVDRSGYIDQTIEGETLPQINLYDKHQRLLRCFPGLQSIDSLHPYLLNE